MHQHPSKGQRARLLKLFILNNEGACVGEFPLDDECVVEFPDFVAAVGDSALGDGQMFYLGEHSATVIHGDSMSLVAISKGRPGQEEIDWSKGILATTENYLKGKGEHPAAVEEDLEEEPEDEPPKEAKKKGGKKQKEERKEEVAEEPPLPARPTPPALPPDASLSEREQALIYRERELADAEDKAWRAIVRENETRTELEDVRQKLTDLESQAKIEKRRLEREIERLKEELAEKAKN